MIRRPPRSTRTDTLFPYTTLVRSEELIIFGSFADHAQNADVSGMMMTAGVDAAGNLELQFTQIPLPLGVGEPLADLLRHMNQPRIRSDARRVGRECVSTCVFRCTTYH